MRLSLGLYLLACSLDIEEDAVDAGRMRETNLENLPEYASNSRELRHGGEMDGFKS